MGCKPWDEHVEGSSQVTKLLTTESTPADCRYFSVRGGSIKFKKLGKAQVETGVNNPRPGLLGITRDCYRDYYYYYYYSCYYCYYYYYYYSCYYYYYYCYCYCYCYYHYHYHYHYHY